MFGHIRKVSQLERPSFRLSPSPTAVTTTMATLFSPLRTSYRYLVSSPCPSTRSNWNECHFFVQQQRQAHEQPVIFYSCVLGLIGPVMLVTVPPVRTALGYKSPEQIPTTYPRASS